MKHSVTRALFGSTSNSGCVPSGVHSGVLGGAPRGVRSGLPGGVPGGALGDPSAQSGKAKADGCLPANVLKHLPGSVLADALHLWDCVGASPASNNQIVLRFEKTDVLCMAGAGNQPALQQGAVDTSAVYCDKTTGQGRYAWLPSGALAPALGQQVISAYSDAQGAFVVVFDSCFIRLSSHDGKLCAFLSN